MPEQRTQRPDRPPTPDIPGVRTTEACRQAQLDEQHHQVEDGTAPDPSAYIAVTV